MVGYENLVTIDFMDLKTCKPRFSIDQASIKEQLNTVFPAQLELHLPHKTHSLEHEKTLV